MLPFETSFRVLVMNTQSYFSLALAIRAPRCNMEQEFEVLITRVHTFQKPLTDKLFRGVQIQERGLCELPWSFFPLSASSMLAAPITAHWYSAGEVYLSFIC